MDFYGDFADAEIAGHLLVHFSGCDVKHYFLFARRKGFEALPQLRDVALDDAPLSVAFDGRHYGIEHVLVAKRFWKEIYGTVFHRMHGHRNVAKPGHHNHRHSNPRLGQSALKLKAVHVRKSDIKNDATRPLRELSFEEVFRRGVSLGLKSDRLEETFERTAHRNIVVNDVYKRSLVGDRWHPFCHPYCCGMCLA